MVLSVGCKSPFRDKTYVIKVTDAYTDKTIQGAKVTFYKCNSEEPTSLPVECAKATSNSGGDVSFSIDYGNRGSNDGYLYKGSMMN